MVAPPTTVPTSTSTSSAQNLVVTDTVRSQLLQAGAKLNNLPASAYTGLRPGRTYYAYDPATATYWAGAQLVPSSSSLAAQVSVQDDGAYDIFTSTTGGAWTASLDGLGGIGGTSCTPIPASVLAVWHWSPGTCRPPG